MSSRFTQLTRSTATLHAGLPVLLVLGVAVVASVLSLRYFYLAWAWTALAWAIALAMSAWMIQRQWLRLLLVNLAAVCLTFMLAEIWFSPALSAPDDVYSGDYMGEYFVDHPLLGYGPKVDFRARSTRSVDGEIVYDTLYSINSDGRRITPQATEADRAVLVFGGSFTFGEGVQDAEAMPYRFGELAGSGYQVYNFGFHGYGPHQMLAALEFSLADKATDLPVSHVIYQTIPDHVHRAAGRAFWDKSGPRYELTAAGDAVFAGHFDDGKGAIRKALPDLLNKSQLYRRLFGVQQELSQADVQLYAGIVERAQQLVQQNYPQAEFHVLLWGYPGSDAFEMVSGALASRDIKVHPVIDILPYYANEAQRYELHPQDTHPNALAHDEIARYLAEEIL